MKKRIIAIVLVAIMALTLFVGCESYRFKALSEVSDKNAVVESNGGLAVKQGNYVYFINAESDYDYTESKENYFNGKSNKLLGAIVRVKLDENGIIVENSQTVVVPKNVMTSYTGGGFYIYGEWIYYTSPSTASDASGSLKAYLDVLRTKTDGTKTQKLVTVKSQNFQYTVTPESFVYYDSTEKTLHYINTTVKRGFKDVVVDEKIASIVFPENTTYNPASPNLYASAVFYTKNYEDDTKRVNQVYALDTAGKTYCVMEENTWTSEPQKIENIEKVFSITLKSAKQTEKGIALYFRKQFYKGGSLTEGGLWSVEFDSSSTPFAVSGANNVPLNNKKLADADATTMYIIDASSYYYLDGNVLKKVEAGKDEKEIIDFDHSITFAFFYKSGEVEYIYYTKDSKLYRIAFSFDANGDFVDPVTNEQTVLTSTSNISTSWLKAELVGNYYFYSNSSDKYTYAVDLTSFVNYDTESVKDFLVGKKIA